MAEHATTETAAEIVTKAALSRAWTDIEPKLLAWLATNAPLNAASTVYAYLYPNGPVPVWLPFAVSFVVSGLVGYLKKSTIKIPTKAESAAAEATATQSQPSLAGITAEGEAATTFDEPEPAAS